MSFLLRPYDVPLHLEKIRIVVYQLIYPASKSYPASEFKACKSFSQLHWTLCSLCFPVVLIVRIKINSFNDRYHQEHFLKFKVSFANNSLQILLHPSVFV